MNKQLFQSMSSWAQLFFLLLFTFFSFFFLSLFIYIVGANNPELVTSVSFLRFSVALQSIIIFLVPALLCVYLFYNKSFRYLKVDKSIDIRFLILSVILIIAVQPIVSFLGFYNNQMALPAALSGLEQQMRVWEDLATQTMETLLLGGSIQTLILNIFIVAIIAGLAEEFFFRGALQQIFEKIYQNKHLAVWTTAFIFSAIHLQFYGFFPRLFLGALLGYLFVWSGNLWIPVILHAINNMMSVLLFHFYYKTNMYDRLENIGVGDTWWTTPISVVIVVLICYLLIRDYSKQRLDEL